VRSKKTMRLRIAAGVVLGVAGAVIVTGQSAGASSLRASDLTAVPAPNTKTAGITSPNVLSPGLAETVAAQGSQRLENGTAALPYYGYRGDGPLLPAPGSVQKPGTVIEASKTEPDKNTYLRLTGEHGADAAYDYGTHFLFQGHEGAGAGGAITRINLDADAAHRVTLLASTDADGKPLPAFDGSTWDPFAQRLLFTSENDANGGVWQATADAGSRVEDISAAVGRAGYEGVQTDAAGNVWLVEDSSGTTVATKAKLPNSFVYRFVPTHRGDLTHGRLQVLQVISNRTNTPITFQAADAAHPTGNAFSADTKDLHTYGQSFRTHWVTVHDTAVDTSGKPFDANAAAKAAGATPFKRPENGQFRPGTDFRQFYFTETGDTNTDSTANDGFGGYGAIMRVTLDGPSSDSGHLDMVFAADKQHTGLDNLAFFDRDHLAVVEDAGDGLHTQRNALDSAYLFDVSARPGTVPPVRFLAEGRDPSATIDSAYSDAGNGFQNEGDNEITGLHISNGDPTPNGLLGAAIPNPFKDGWRIFWTQQHGDNTTWEIVPSRTR
jgi:uncharacterized protein DUF839